jgi:hypothetical protein
VDEELGHRIRYSMLVKVADDHDWGKKTYNNAISVCAPYLRLNSVQQPQLDETADHLYRVDAGGAGIGGRDDKARRRRDDEGFWFGGGSATANQAPQRKS